MLIFAEEAVAKAVGAAMVRASMRMERLVGARHVGLMEAPLKVTREVR